MATENLGKLEVEIDGNEKGLDTSVKKSEASLKRLGKTGTETTEKMSRGVKAVTVAFVAMVGSVAAAITKTVQANTELNRLAQSMGLTVEEMSGLGYAAKASGVGVDKLKASVSALVRGLDEAAGENAIGPTATALRALGISATTASGELRTATDVMRDVADQFATMKDGSNKTAVAIALFGEAGAELIPMLNQGSAGLRKMEEEAARLGITIDTRTAKAADHLNNTMGKVVSVFIGVVQTATTELVPVIQRIADGFLEWVRTSDFVKASADTLVTGVKILISVFAELKTFISAVGSALYGVGVAFVEFATLNFSKGVEAIKSGMAEASKTMEENERFQADLWNGWMANVEYAAKETPTRIAPVISSVKSWEEATRQLHDANRNMLDYILEQDTTPYQQKLDAIDQAVRQGTIGWREYGNMVKKVNETAQTQMDGLLTQTTQVLGSIFTESKAVGIATAIINTYQGITKALATMPPPMSYVAAALTAAQGFAQIASMRSTTTSSTSVSKPATPSGGSLRNSSGNGGDRERNAAPSSPQTLYVHGIGPKQLFSGDVVRELATKLLDYQRDGGRVVLAQT